jgi:hypothetical protein
MFTTLKVRKGLGANDYRDPGWFRHPAGTVAHEWQGAPPDATAARQSVPGQAPQAPRVRKPGAGHERH